MEFDCPLRLCDKTAVDVAVGRPPAADKTVALVVVVDDVVLMTLVVGKLASVAADTVAVGLMVRAELCASAAQKRYIWPSGFQLCTFLGP